MPEVATAARGTALLGLARRSLEAALRSGPRLTGPSFPSSFAWLAEPGATFVTLFAGDELRGCVGSVLAERSLAEDVWENARAAAFRDGRFPPLAAGELVVVRIEVSELSPLEELTFRGVEEARAALRPGIDGALLQWGSHRGVFLPQVWEHLPRPERFLVELNRKAGLPPEFWASDLRLWRFTVAKWREPARTGR